MGVINFFRIDGGKVRKLEAKFVALNQRVINGAGSF